MRRAVPIPIAVTAALTALVTYGLVSIQPYLGWHVVPERMIRDYVIALFVCKEDVRQGAEALTQLKEIYGFWREELLPSGIHHWVVRCEEFGPIPEFGPHLERWLQ
jgi:hypothetical protein